LKLCRETARALPVAAPEERERMLTPAPEPALHARLQAVLPALHAVEVAPAPSAGAPLREARVVAWNAERGGAVEGAVALLRSAAADAALLSELDLGMARSGQIHAARELAGGLGMGFAFGVEFVELGLGNAEERARCAGRLNRVGYHGNAIASAYALERPALVRLDAGGDWFDGRRGERRVGGRIALLATLRVGGAAVALASVHLESHGGPELRDAQAAALLEALDAYAPGAPALVGGDFNTHALGLEELEDRDALLRAVRADPARFAEPWRHEPLFARLEAAGFDWRSCNAPAVPTERRRIPAGSERGALHLDWLFARGLAVSRAEVLPAVDPANGRALSDHEALAVTIAPSFGRR
jgi:endonuclease/exonuclease/phosphatase family metal-dependent hydrolase